MKRLFFIFLISVLPLQSWASVKIGEIVRLEGNVKVFRDGGVRGMVVKDAGTPLYSGDSVKSKRKSVAYISLVDGSRVVLKENSSLEIGGLDRANVSTGVVLFEIKKRGKAKGLEITSATVTMGVRGTRFAVKNIDEKVNIYLKEGALQIGTLEGKFKKHSDKLKAEHEELKKTLEQDFLASQAKMKAQFEEAQNQMQAGNLEYVSEFLLEEGSAIYIVNGEVWNVAISEGINDDFDMLDQF